MDLKYKGGIKFLEDGIYKGLSLQKDENNDLQTSRTLALF